MVERGGRASLSECVNYAPTALKKKKKTTQRCDNTNTDKLRRPEWRLAGGLTVDRFLYTEGL